MSVPETQSTVIIFDGPDVSSRELKLFQSDFHTSSFHCTTLFHSYLSSNENNEQIHYHFTAQENVSDIIVNEQGLQRHFSCKGKSTSVLQIVTNISLFINVTIISLTLQGKTSAECSYAGISAYDEDFTEIATQCQESNLIAPNRRMYSKGRTLLLVLYSSLQTQQFNIVFTIGATKCQLTTMNLVEFCNPICPQVEINHTILKTRATTKNTTIQLNRNQCVIIQFVFLRSKDPGLAWLTNTESDLVVQLEPNSLPGELIKMSVLGFMSGISS